MNDDEDRSAEVAAEPARGAWRPTRRQAIKLAAAGTASGAAGLGAWRLLDDPARSDHAASVASGPDIARTLVIIELGGGNDGLSTLIPHEDGRYHDLRPTMALSGPDVVEWEGGWGLNSRLAGLATRGLSIVAGVGTSRPDLSHFEMSDRWSAGTPDGAIGADSGSFGPGFLGRLCDALGQPGELTGLSLHPGDHPAMRSASAATTGLDVTASSPFTDDAVADQVRRLIRDLAGRPLSDGFQTARGQLDVVGKVLDFVAGLPAPEGDYPDTRLGHQLEFASRVIRADLGIRVVHVPIGGFDTHKNHRILHAELMTEVGDAMARFSDDLTSSGVAEHVLVATTSEFGRRPGEHGDGLDHGTASEMMLLGPTVAGLHGEPASLRSLDERDNLIASLEFDRYYATLAAWLEVDPERVLTTATGGSPRPIEGILKV